MAQVYAIVHNGRGNFLIAFKNLRGYYFHNPKNPGQGSILPAGKVLNGANNWAFPGGKLESADIKAATIVAGAIQEMMEETMVTLDPSIESPGYYTGTDDAYYGVYFFAAGASFNPIVNAVRANLQNALRAADAIKTGKWTGSYPDLLHDYNCPMDNELSNAFVWNLFDDWQEICRLNNSDDTSWYYDILKNLRDTFFPIRVTDANAKTVGIGRAMAEIAGPEYIVDTLLFDPAGLTGHGQYTLTAGADQYPGLKFNPGTSSGDAGIFKPV